MKSPTHAAVPADPAGTGEAPGPAVQPGKVLGIFDLGSNSVRLMLVRVGPVNASCTVLNQVKHMVRLGEGVFLHGRLNEEAMQRTVHVLQGMAGMCSAYGVTDIVACATAAVRDADNARLSQAGPGAYGADLHCHFRTGGGAPDLSGRGQRPGIQ